MATFETLAYPPGQGRWSPVTASINWCETDYAVSYWVAEMVNTLSNIPFMLLGLYGIYRAVQAGFPLRVALSYLGLVVVGAGSFWFHATLHWRAQLCDELPMIFFSSFLAWSVFNAEPGYDNTAFSLLSMAAIFGLDAVMSVAYINHPVPEYHQVVFAAIMICLVFRTAYLIKSRLPEADRAAVTSLYQSGALCFLAGFAIWNVDEQLCSWLQAGRAAVGPALGVLLEGHAWWHVGTGLGCYRMVTAATLLVLTIKSPRGERFEFVPSFGGLLPYVRRKGVDPDKTK